MVNILFDCPNIDDFREELCECLRPGMKVAVAALSFYDDYVNTPERWESVYGEGGRDYVEITDSLAVFGIKREDISFINYFTDTTESATGKIIDADAVYFTGGLPDRMMDRIREMGLCNVLSRFDGVVLGYSAGAVIQLDEYHLSPDADYPEFGYYEGLGYLSGFHIEVHYEHKPTQDEAIKRVLAERGGTVYVTHTRGGGVVVHGDHVEIIGRVDVYKAE